MNIYWIIVAIVIIFGMIMPQSGYNRKYYVVFMAIVHTFVCAFRYQYLVGDLVKYHTEFVHLRSASYLSDETIHEWKNTGFYWLMKFIGDITNGNYQAFLIVLSVFTGIVTAVLIYRYSPRPWLSYVVWNCMAFYLTYDFLAIKQGLAMAVLMLAMMCIFEEKPVGFWVLTLLAGFIHMPALIFLPAYYIANRRVNGILILTYIASAVVIFTFKMQIIDMVAELYYDDDFNLVKEGIGGRVIVIVLILLAGLFLKGFKEKRFSQLFNIIVVAAILQMFSGFDNVFTRLADYCLQFATLFIPMIFYDTKDADINRDAAPAILAFNERSIKIIVACIVMILIWWYWTTTFRIRITNKVDDFLNFRFFWQVN